MRGAKDHPHYSHFEYMLPNTLFRTETSHQITNHSGPLQYGYYGHHPLPFSTYL